MGDGGLSVRDLLGQLRERGLLEESEIEGISRRLRGMKHTPEIPWYLKMLVAVGAWMAAGCFLAFLQIGNVISFETEPLVGAGTLFIAAATALRYFKRTLFPIQFALATSIAGHAMMLAGAY